MLTTADAIADDALLATAEGLVRVTGEEEALAALTRLVGEARAARAMARLHAQERVVAASRGRILSPCCDARSTTMRRRTRRPPIVMPGTTPRR